MVILSPGKKSAKIVPAGPHWIMLAIELRARLRLNRFRHHAHGHGASSDANGGVGKCDGGNCDWMDGLPTVAR
jgi:hypothetical protein